MHPLTIHPEKKEVKIKLVSSDGQTFEINPNDNVELKSENKVA